MPSEEPNFIFGCGNSCIFCFPSVGGIAINGGCRCVDKDMSQEEIVALRKKIRDLVNYASILRATLNDYKSNRGPKDIK